MNFFDITSLKAEKSFLMHSLHEALVSEYIALLEYGACIQIGLSCGKDSSVVMNAAVDAMDRCINIRKTVERTRPLVAITVDTLLEPEPIQCYVPFAHRDIRATCSEKGINLHLEIASPPLHKQLMILFAGAQKLPATSDSGRSADCSVIWKIDTAIATLKEIKTNLPPIYQESKWVSVSGSRSQESVRRSANMTKQGVKDLMAQQLIETMESDADTSGKVYRFAPIHDWSADDVMSYLSHAGSDPISASAPNCPVAGYSEHFGLLLAIYGEGTNEVCEIVADEKSATQGKSCGGTARFGCVTCTMVSEDKSSFELKKYPRWGRFGDGPQRLRDYMQRVANDVTKRAFHPRSYDPAANNNVFMQPNTLKAKYLEKFVWYASQITEDCKAIHKEFTERYQNGLLAEDEGIQDILADTTLSEKVKKQYVEMYTARLLEKPMFELFTEEHALMLSMLWSLHGVATLPYRPIAILDMVQKGKRIPFPKTNAELNAERASLGLPAWNDPTVLNKSIPDALLARVVRQPKSFQKTLASAGGELTASDLTEYLPWDIQKHAVEQCLEFYTFFRENKVPEATPINLRKFSLTYVINNVTNEESVKAKDINAGKVIPLEEGSLLWNELIELGRADFKHAISISANKQGCSLADAEACIKVSKGDELWVTRTHEFNNQRVFRSPHAGHLKDAKSRKKAGRRFSMRKREFDNKTGKFTATRSSLNTYNPSVTPELENSHSKEINYWVPDFHKAKQLPLNIFKIETAEDEDLRDMAMFFSEEKLDWDKFVHIHDNTLIRRIELREKVRGFAGVSSALEILSSTPLKLSPKFEATVRHTLARTNLYYNQGLFDLSDKSYEEIEKEDCVITMGEHRSQKANHLLAVRYLRNKYRAQTKALIGVAGGVDLQRSSSMSNFTNRLRDFTEHFTEIFKCYLACNTVKPMVTKVTQADVCKIWLDEHISLIENSNAMMKFLCTKDELEIINSTYDDAKKAKEYFSNAMKNCAKEIIDYAHRIGSKLQTLNSLATQGNVEHFKVHGSATAGYDYILTDKAEALIDSLGETINEGHFELNRFLVSHGFKIMFSRLAMCDNLNCFNMVDPQYNTLEHKHKRKASEMVKLQEVMAATDPKLNQWLSSLEKITLNAVEDMVRNEKMMVGSTVATEKLKSLNADRIEKLRKLRSINGAK